MNRRIFLKSGGMAMLSLGFTPGFLTRAAAEGTRRRLLIAIFQRGAVDGLNMVPPYGEADYYRLRPTIAIPRPGSPDMAALDLDGFFALHPSLAPLLPLWRNQSFAIVHACGSPANTRSHFEAQDFMETATPGVRTTRDGWLNRYLALQQADRSPLRGVALTRQMPRSLQGTAPSLAIGGVDEFTVRGGTRTPVESTFASTPDALLGTLGREAFEAMRTLEHATTTPYRPANGADYPATPFGRAMQEIARIAKADVGLEIAFTESGNWDHHVNEGGAAGGQLANRLDDLGRGLAALTTDLGDLMADTVILTMSEFGRTVAENGTRGTDHGHGNAMLVIGGPVRGGSMHGRWPGLREQDRFEGRDLAVTTDFRDVFSDVLIGHLGAPPASLARVFPGFTPGVRPGLIRV
jgi:uncharacterized protein (DUF1501 family)